MTKIPKSITLSIDSRLDCVCFVGWAVRGICISLGLAEDCVFCLELAVCEAVSNAIEHGYGKQPGHEVQIDLHMDSRRLHIQVLNQGKEFDLVPRNPSSVEHVPGDCSCIPERGRGLEIIASVMDEWNLSRTSQGVNILTMSKKIG